MKKRKKKNNVVFKIISTLLLIVTVIFIFILSYSDLVPMKYFKIILLVLLIFNVFNIFILNLKKLKRKVKYFACFIIFIAMIIMGVGSSYLYKTTSVLQSNGDSKYKIENYSVIVLKSSNYDTLKDIKGNIGYYENSSGSEKAVKELKKKVNNDFDNYNASDVLLSELINKNIDAILVENSIINLIKEENHDFDDITKVIYTFKIKVNSTSSTKEANVTKEPFIVYLSGIDTYGEIASVSRSDVNIVAVINPKIKQVLLISIPRDYYVKLHGTKGYNDKLTHAGIYGVDMSIKTIEDLLDIDINYYVKVNFTSVIDIVNALGGLDVYSEYTFTSYSGYNFKKGMNSVNGEQALDFARTRKAFANGDRQRGINQQAIIEAAVRKATSKTIITKYTSLLNSVDGKYQTNMSYKKITSLIKMQLNDMSPWTITSYSLTGSDSSNYTYTYNQLLYVMEPDKESVDEAKNLIGEVLGNNALDSSYNDISGNSYKVSQNKTTTNNTSTQKKETEQPKKETSVKDVEKNETKKEETEKKETIDNDKKDEAVKDNNSDQEIDKNKDENEQDENILNPITPTDDKTDNKPEDKNDDDKSNDKNQIENGENEN